MKNIGIVLQESVTATLDKGVDSVFNALFLNGYVLDEVRILPYYSTEIFKKNLQSVCLAYDNIFLVTEKRFLERIKRSIETDFPNGKVYSAFASAMIYAQAKSSIFLLSSDETETGVGYIRNACISYLQQRYGLKFDKIVVRSIGASTALIDNLLFEAQKLCLDKIALQHTRKYDEDVIELIYNSNTPKMLADDVLRMFVEGLGDTMYAMNDTKLENQLVSLLKVRGKKLSVAESFTGGGIARRVVSVSGASEVYFEGLNTYNETSKVKRLGVSAYTLKTMGAVSEQTAYEMALGLLNTGDCDLAIATTGLAGPKSDRSELPVGLCCLAIGTKEKICVYQYRFDGTREEITEKAINYALFLAYKRLKDM